MLTSKYYVDEFYLKRSIDSFCKLISKDIDVIIDAKKNKVDWLNEVLRLPKLYDDILLKKYKSKLISKPNLLKKKKDSRIKKDNKYLVLLTNDIRKKSYDDLNDNEKSMLIRFNRYMLDSIYNFAHYQCVDPTRENIDIFLNHNIIYKHINFPAIDIEITLSTNYLWNLSIKVYGPDKKFTPAVHSFNERERDDLVSILKSALQKMKTLKEQMISPIKIPINEKGANPFIEIESEATVTLKFWLSSPTYKLARILSIESVEELITTLNMAEDLAQKLWSEWVLIND